MTPRSITCHTCGAPFEHAATSGGGRPPRHCPAHRKPRGEVRDVEGAKARRLERQRTKRRAAPDAKKRRPLDVHDVRDLAAALSVFSDSKSAAEFIGLQAKGKVLDELVARAKRVHPDVIDADPGALGRVCLAAMHLCVSSTIRGREVIAPRDQPHVTRAMAQTYDLVGAGQRARFASIQLVVVGADGVPFDPTA